MEVLGGDGWSCVEVDENWWSWVHGVAIPKPTQEFKRVGADSFPATLKQD